MQKCFSFFFIFSILLSSITKAESEEKIKNYLSKLYDLRANFIEVNGNNISEGLISINNERLKIIYNNPNPIEIILSKNKAMYYNKSLQEVEFFNPKNTIAEIFFNIFYKENFFDGAKFENKEGFTTTKQTRLIEDTKYSIDILFENKPTTLRKINVDF